MDVFHVPRKDITIADGLSRLEGYPRPHTPHEVNNTAFTADDNLTVGDPVTEVPNEMVNEWEIQWHEWLDDPWYADVIEFQGAQAEAQRVLADVERTVTNRKAKRFVMVAMPTRNRGCTGATRPTQRTRTIF